MAPSTASPIPRKPAHFSGPLKTSPTSLSPSSLKTAEAPLIPESCSNAPKTKSRSASPARSNATSPPRHTFPAKGYPVEGKEAIAAVKPKDWNTLKIDRRRKHLQDLAQRRRGHHLHLRHRHPQRPPRPPAPRQPRHVDLLPQYRNHRKEIVCLTPPESPRSRCGRRTPGHTCTAPLRSRFGIPPHAAHARSFRRHACPAADGR